MNDLLVAVTLHGRRCAFRALDVQSVIETGNVTPVPGAPNYLVGLTAMRSQVLSVIDCRCALGLDKAGLSTDVRAPVVTVNGHGYALLVDEVEDVTRSLGDPEPVLGGFGDGWSRATHGMIETGRGPLLLLDVEQLIGGPAKSEVAA